MDKLATEKSDLLFLNNAIELVAPLSDPVMTLYTFRTTGSDAERFGDLIIPYMTPRMMVRAGNSLFIREAYPLVAAWHARGKLMRVGGGNKKAGLDFNQTKTKLPGI